MRLVTLTVSPQISYCGFSAPITPAITGPWFRPENAKSLIWRSERFSLDGSYASGRPNNDSRLFLCFVLVSMYCYANQSGPVSNSFCIKSLICSLPQVCFLSRSVRSRICIAFTYHCATGFLFTVHIRLWSKIQGARSCSHLPTLSWKWLKEHLEIVSSFDIMAMAKSTIARM